MIPFKDQLKGLEEFEARAKYTSMTEKERNVYERNLKTYRDNVMVMRDAVQEGIEIGIKEGRKEGRKEGIKEGRKEGMTEGILESARKFIGAGVSRMQVRQILGLTDADMAAL